MNKIFFLICLILGCGWAQAEKLPEVSVYYTSPGDNYSPVAIGIFKLSNRTDRTYYINGDSINDVAALVQILKDGKWVDKPNEFFICGTGNTFYPLFPGASLLFQIYAPAEEKAKWRVKLGLYEKAEPQGKQIVTFSPTVQITEPMRL